MNIVCDLDGTLCDHAHRFEFCQSRNWEEYHGRLQYDKPHDDVLDFISAMQENHSFIFLTGRNERFRFQTGKWMRSFHLLPEVLIMRPDHDYTPDNILKPKMLIDHFEGDVETAKASIDFILDDRDGVVEAFRNLGFNCWQVRNGAY